jgi:hypothetical protein
VRQRAILSLLRDDASDLPDQAIKALVDLDANLKMRTIRGDFIWEPEVQPGFLPDIFWYLYLAKP